MTRASDTAKLLGAGATILDGTTISTADNTDTLTLKSTDADANTGPTLFMQRDSASPADGDSIGKISFVGDNDAGETTRFARIDNQIADASNGTEDALMFITTMIGGTELSRMTLQPTEAVFNEESADIDFRVESNNDANAFFVEGSTGNIGIGTNSPAGDFHLTDASDIRILFTSDQTGNTGSDGTFIGLTDGGIFNIRNRENTNTIFYTNDTERMRIVNGGNVLVGTTDQSPAEGTGVGVRLGNNGASQISSTGQPTIHLNRVQDGEIVNFRSAGSQEGNISISGTTTSYNGGHISRWSRLLNNSKDTSIVKGTVMTNLNEMIEWSYEDVLWTDEDELPDGVSVGDVKKSAYTEDNEQLNKMAVSSVEGDANVAGVFVNWDDDDDFNDMNIAMTGDMVIRIAQGTTVSRGDLLMSAGDGTAKPQGDDIVRSKTIAKVTSTNVSHTYDDGTYLVPCVLMAC